MRAGKGPLEGAACWQILWTLPQPHTTVQQWVWQPLTAGGCHNPLLRLVSCQPLPGLLINKRGDNCPESGNRGGRTYFPAPLLYHGKYPAKSCCTCGVVGVLDACKYIGSLHPLLHIVYAACLPCQDIICGMYKPHVTHMTACLCDMMVNVW